MMETEQSVNRGNYIELLKYTAKYDPLLVEHVKNSTVFRGLSNPIQNNPIEAVSSGPLVAMKN